MREKGSKFHYQQQPEWKRGGGGVVGEFSFPLLKINCLFLSLIFGSAVVVLPIPHRPFLVSLLSIGAPLSHES